MESNDCCLVDDRALDIHPRKWSRPKRRLMDWNLPKFCLELPCNLDTNRLGTITFPWTNQCPCKAAPVMVIGPRLPLGSNSTTFPMGESLGCDFGLPKSRKKKKNKKNPLPRSKRLPTRYPSTCPLPLVPFVPWSLILPPPIVRRNCHLLWQPRKIFWKFRRMSMAAREWPVPTSIMENHGASFKLQWARACGMVGKPLVIPIDPP
mmetsp:Transcript_34410/g.83543  ORF Transcript_34410/g.83543 Transcript_34410/m.83543 type:complete len:206 (+) Transcript_34410:894-1511(+)